MLGMDVFTDDAFSARTLTFAVNQMPYLPQQVSRLGLFEEIGVMSPQIAVEREGWTLSLIPNTPVGSPPSRTGASTRSLIPLMCPNLQVETSVHAASLMGVREFGSETNLKTVQRAVNKALEKDLARHDTTLEYGRMGALQGIVYDADGTTPIANLLTAFGITRTTVYFNLASADENVKAKCAAVQNAVIDELGGTPFTGMHALCGQAFFDALRDHPKVAKAYEAWEAARAWFAGDPMAPFNFGKIDWEQYRGMASPTFIPDDEAILIPKGVVGLCQTAYAPADFLEATNSIGLPRYAKLATDQDYNRFVKVLTVSRPLSYVTRPKAIIRLKMGTTG